MDFEEFKNVIKRKLEIIFPNATINFIECFKTNITLTGLSIVESDAKTSPCIYLEEFYEDYKGGVDIDTCMKKLLRLYNENKHSYEKAQKGSALQEVLNIFITLEDLDIAIQALSEIQQYRAIGTAEQLKTMFDGFWKLKDLCEEYEKYGLPEDYWKLNEICKEYSAIGTVEEFKVLKEKNEPKKVQYDEYGKEEGYPYCECGRCLIDDFVGVSYCPDCGQKLDWQ